MTASAASALGSSVQDATWLPDLARAVFEDRRDAKPPVSEDDAARMARRYAAWLERLNAGPGEIERRWEEEARQWPGDLFFHVGKPTIFVAPQGHGKTNAATFLLEKALRLRRDWDIYTNIPFPWDDEFASGVPRPPNLHSVHRATQLLRGFATTIQDDRIPAALLDETGQWLSSHDWRTDAAEAMTKFTYVERHFRVRGPILVYHTWRTVLEPFRAEGDLRGSYCRVVKRNGQYRVAREEDRSRWWVIGGATLPYLTLGLTGFDMDVNFQELGRRLRGGLKAVAEQTLEYLDDLEARRAAEEAILSESLSEDEASSLREYKSNLIANRSAAVDRDRAIMQALRARPNATMGELVVEFRTTYGHLQKLRQRLSSAAERATPSLSVGGG